ncbi:hypothetical protein [Candidatus Nitrososphaera sp. FF02]|uniref:hypothetical protein n=1 Tax=Candidatus Nitrososphaera sp. FF02 TaxID=3398226 RepID=UPI0039E986A5
MAAIDELKALLQKGCKVQKVQPAAFASDAEVSVVTVTVACSDRIHTLRAYREEAKEIREFIRKQALQL